MEEDAGQEVLTISLSGGNVQVAGAKYITDDDVENQSVTFVDGGDIDSVHLSHWGDEEAEDGVGMGGDDTFSFDLSGFNDDFKMSFEGLDSGDTIQFTNFDSYVQEGNVYAFYYTGTDGQQHVVKFSADSVDGAGTVTVMVCFCRGTLIQTTTGEVPIENLCAGDAVVCGDGQLRPIRWIGASRVSRADLSAHPELRPVSIMQHAFGHNRPNRDLKLSPQHKIFFQDWRAELLFGEAEVLISAKMLVNDSTVRTDNACEEIDYFHILLDKHRTVIANGLECETLMPAEMAMTGLSPRCRTEILVQFPEVCTMEGPYRSMYATTLKQHEVSALFA